MASQTNESTVLDSEIGLLVNAVYAHPFFLWTSGQTMRDAVRKQIAMSREFVAAHPEWVLAKTAQEAMAAYKKGKQILVLSLEGASEILETDEDLREFVDEGGIRIITPLHLVNDHFGGVTFLKGFMALSTPLSWIESFWNPQRDEGVRTNSLGLLPAGRELIQKLIQRKIWIDLSHASDPSAREMISMLEAARQPLLYTHTSLRKYHGAERGIPAWQLRHFKSHGGFVGLMASQQMLEGTAVAPEFCCPGQANCEGGLPALATQYRELAHQIGAENIGFGTDYNGGVTRLPPDCRYESSLGKKGFWQIAQQSSVWDALEAAKVPLPQPRSESIRAFIKLWGKADGTY